MVIKTGGKKMRWQYSFKYFAHVFLILATLFATYRIGDYLLNFQSSIVKMFIWFFVIFFIADNVFEDLLGI